MVEVAFYIASKGKLYDKLVSFFTGAKYSHMELCLDNICYSSSNRDGGVRSKVINLNSDKWHIIEIDCDRKKVYEFYEATKNCGYDYLSVIANLVLRLKIDLMLNNYHCFEWCVGALNYANDTQINVNSNIDEIYNKIKTLELKND
jgi:hypothetical protein